MDLWFPPPGNDIKLNFDGSYKPITKTASIGGTIRSSARTLLLAYSGRIAAENSLEAELKALFKGTDLRKDMNITHLQIEGDCLILVNSLQKSDSLSCSFMETWGSLIPNLTKFQWWEASLSCRNANKVAYCLAKFDFPTIQLFKS